MRFLSQKLKSCSGVLWCSLFFAFLVSFQAVTGHDAYGQGLAITQVRMVFENGKAVYSVEPGGLVQAYTVIKYRGAGVFEGQWKVNGRLLSRVQKHLNGSRSFTVSTPQVPSLPTEQIGPYRLEFVITTPQSSYEQPFLTYHVMGQANRTTKPSP